MLATIESINFVDKSMGNGGKTRHMFGLPRTIEEAAQSAANCKVDVQPAMRQGMMSFKSIMTLGLSRSQRLYQRLEDLLVAEASEVCGPIGPEAPEETLSNDGSFGSVSTARRRRAEV